MLKKTGLFGLYNSNRGSEEHWGKNCFNSSFPTSLASYMLEHKKKAIYLTLKPVDNELKVVSEEISIPDVFNSGQKKLEELFFSFESKFEPYDKYATDMIDGIDLVVKDLEGNFLSPLEIKLTVMPDSTTFKKPPSEWGAEMVIRSATTSYCALGMFDSVATEKDNIREIFENVCAGIQMWDNDFEVTHNIPKICQALNVFEKRYWKNQSPLLMQTLWKTEGQSPILCDDAFDIVIWSNFAFSRLFIDSAMTDKSKKMSRPMRSTARLARCLWELSKSNKIRLEDIYRQMAYGNQTDKEFSISGTKWRSYVNTPRLQNLAVKKESLERIIDNDSIEKLRPERRFDQTLYFARHTETDRKNKS
ncbi:MAG: HindVP family restriction endonuclease [Turicibacter sp.]|nr:HindVP family restriction endonuclease [Turicibacter sp.]